jgi:predicted Zn finger-like uncharacterized protein
MKITCQSCQSKYNVADEKVQGKTVKIRCRKCGATIVVDGTAAATNGASGASPTPSAPAPSAQAPSSEGQEAATWHVNVAENDQRTMSLAEVVDAYNSGVVTQDTFIWTDGMEDWKPLAEVEAVVAALHQSAQPATSAAGAYPNGHAHETSALPKMTAEEPGPDASTHAYQPAAAAAAYSSFEPAIEAPAPAVSAPAAQASFASPAAASRPEAKRAAVRRENRSRDLFASRAEEGPGGFDVQTSAPVISKPLAAIDDGGKGRTGERNENSVLFSLSVLTQNADQRAPTQDTSGHDDSGLIDLKALAAKTESMRPPSAMADAAVFAPAFGAMQPLGAPVGAFDAVGDGQGKSKLPLYIMFGLGGVVLMVVGALLGARLLGGSPAPVPSAAASAIAAPSASVAAPEPEATASATAAATASAAPSATVAATRPRPVGGGGAAAVPRPATKPAAQGGGDTPAPAAAPPPAKKGDCGCNGDLMCLMKCSTH